MTLAWPRTCWNAASSWSGPAPASRSTVAAWPPSLARPTSSCSVDTYSSDISLARLPAAAIAASSGRDVSGALSVAPAALRQPGQQLLRGPQNRVRVGPGRAQQRRGGTALLLDQRGQQVQPLHMRVAARRRPPDRLGQGLLALARQLVIHCLINLPRYVRWLRLRRGCGWPARLPAVAPSVCLSVCRALSGWLPARPTARRTRWYPARARAPARPPCYGCAAARPAGPPPRGSTPAPPGAG